MGVKSVHLVSFFGVVGKSNDFKSLQQLSNRQELLEKTALENGQLDSTHSWDLERLKKTDFYRENKELLSEPRGCGYWAWKPFIILETLNSISENDYVIYCDIGRPHLNAKFDYGNQITHSLLPMVEWAELNGGMFPGVYMPHHGEASKWIKQDCFTLMDCDSDEYKLMPTIQAGYTAWKNTPEVKEFLLKWLELNLDRRLISDQENTLGAENADNFVRHCHDQATLTLLCEKEGVLAFGHRKYQFWGFRNINFISKQASWEVRKRKKGHCFSKINVNESLLPRFLNSWVEVLFDYRFHEKLDLNIIDADSNTLNAWKEYCSKAVIDSGNLLNEDVDFSGRYDLIVTAGINSEEYTIDNFYLIFKALKENGLAFIGPLPSNDGSEKLEQFCRSIANEKPLWNAETLGQIKIPNSKNPVFLRTKEQVFILLYKPFELININEQ